MAVDQLFLLKRRERLESMRNRLASLNRTSNNESSRLSAFPMGPGCGNAASRKSHYRSMDASINRATEAVRLAREIAVEEVFLNAYEAGKVDKRGKRMPPSGDTLRGMIAVAEKALEAGALKGRPLQLDEVKALQETLRDLRRRLRKEDREAAKAQSNA